MYMRKLFFVFILALSACSAGRAQTSGKNASIVLDSTSTSLGIFPKSDCVKTVVFTFTNVGNDKLVFYDVAPDCGCVTVKLPEKPVKPGKKGQIVVTYNGKRKSPGTFKRRISFACSGRPAQFRLQVTGTMTEK